MDTRPLPVERLESRRLLSAVLVDGLLVVNGSSLGDDIRIYRAPGPTDAPTYTVEIGPTEGDRAAGGGSARPTRVWWFPLERVRSVLVRAGAGNDVVDLVAATWPIPESLQYGPVAVPSRIDGGIGNDAVHGGTARDIVTDLFGADSIFGHAGNDVLHGGRGNDFLDGGAGNDLVYGSTGDDHVYGGFGDDRLDGGAGNDHVGFNGVGPLPSEPGNDVLSGGEGEDWMVGGQGRDRIYGGAGRDHWSLEDDDSEMLDRTPDEPKDIPQGV